MTPKLDGFYWLTVEGREPTIGRWCNATGWTIIGETLELDPGDPVDAVELSKYALGEMVQKSACAASRNVQLSGSHTVSHASGVGK